MVYSVYFSPTGTSKKGAETIAKVFSPDFKAIDITKFDSMPKDMSFKKDDLVVFGAPVYSGRIYKGASERLKKFKGDSTICIISVTYGNRAFDDALIELSDIVSENGFIPVAGAALVAQHTYGEIQVGRPDDNDVKEDTDFAEKVKSKIENGKTEKISVPGNRPYIKGDQGGKGGSFRPLTNDNCIQCGLCVDNCPEGAIAPDCRTISDKCIACFRCIRNCPMGAKYIDTPEYLGFAESFTKKLSKKLENQYFI
ncbi:MAG: 4Fe-4S binding protein [Clostridia bacterium]|jgi:ferredoxin|nr:4Fe-4S binding protein [Clostridia bacterium]